MNTFVGLFQLVLISGALKFQFTVEYFKDNFLKPPGSSLRDVIYSGDGFNVSGNFVNQIKYNHAIIKIDIDGNVFWSTLTLFEKPLNCYISCSSKSTGLYL